MKSKKAPYFFIAPAIGLLLMFSIFPIILALIISFTDLSLAGLADYSRINFTGLQNYQNILQDSVFMKSITNTLFYVVFGVPLVILFSLTIAILINMGKSRYFSFMRVVFYSPSITNIVAVAIVWAFLFNPSQSIGLINRVIGTIGIGPIGWLTDTSVSKISLVILAVWRSIGINMLIFSAALQNIPRTMYEAAELDGATKWGQIRFITVPQLKFSTSFVTITTIIGWLQFFEEPFVMTEGGPLNSTTSVALFIYRNGFQNNQFGYAAAGSLLLFVVIICATLIQLRLQRRAD
ncbi:carbohydrate ABC transporter permease [Marinilactibacillus sp. Marseille-P9653]|uniref:carbohydrate ABC transporter permease n=1 Tax=Marinilactibacillus sp. Marseille-P9653 TaxID=2866583 RepID=UPI001CE47EAE|nr:sugar ABC transporter permease [Marinilactibacillus sp. Marseille-P9653]